MGELGRRLQASEHSRRMNYPASFDDYPSDDEDGNVPEGTDYPSDDEDGNVPEGTDYPSDDEMPEGIDYDGDVDDGDDGDDDRLYLRFKEKLDLKEKKDQRLKRRQHTLWSIKSKPIIRKKVGRHSALFPIGDAGRLSQTEQRKIDKILKDAWKVYHAGSGGPAASSARVPLELLA